MMPERLPSLNALRAFEAAARLGSLTKAAEELSVTPAAVSHQLRTLEADLGLKLLVREGRSVAPTPQAQAGLDSLRRGFALLLEGTRQIRSAGQGDMLTVSAAPSFAAHWLIPRLERFRERLPEIDVRIDSSWGLTDFQRDGVDLAIRYGPGGYAGLYEHRLLDERFFPVCSPRLVERIGLETPADLAKTELLHVDGAVRGMGWPDWRMWLAAAGVADTVDYRRGTRFLMSIFALQSAVLGNGVTLGSTALVEEYLSAGMLVRPFALSLEAVHGYHLVCPPAALERPHIRVFADWLKEEAASMPQERAAAEAPEAPTPDP
jgi:LysR family glycine cleavage system transcriptional activator